jgi:hypothetical protein
MIPTLFKNLTKCRDIFHMCTDKGVAGTQGKQLELTPITPESSEDSKDTN